MPLLVLLAVCLFGRGAAAQYGGGTGTAEDPYMIYTAKQMNAIGEKRRDWDKHFKLMADIDLADFDGKDGRPSFNIIAPNTGNTYWQFNGTPFTGVFDGNGHTISHLTIRGEGYLGLFGKLESGAEVKDLGVIDVNITGSHNYVGGLVGSNYGRVRRCYSTGVVNGNRRVGGLIGFSVGSVSHCYSTATVSGEQAVGGMVGDNNKNGKLTCCYSTGRVSGIQFVGGLVGLNFGDVTSCFWDTQTSGQYRSDGGTGLTTAQMQMASTFVEWEQDAAWTIDEGVDYPRLAWENLPGEPITKFSYGGGSGTKNDPYIIYTAEQMCAIGANPDDWDKHFKLMEDIDLSAYTGTDFNIIGYFVDWIDSDKNKPFTGVFDGNDHTISNFNYSSTDTDDIGLFGFVGGGTAEIKDLGLINPNIQAGAHVGSLVGFVDIGTITGCYAQDVSVSGTEAVGGLVGLVGVGYGTITRCYSTGTVSGSGYVGGLVGVNEGDVTYCYSTGAVIGSKDIGGLVGVNEGGVTGCYSTGAVSGNERVGGLVGFSNGKVTRSFWDIETSGQTTSAGGTGKTTAEMQMASTFVEWGRDAVWTIDEGKDYPRLSWENLPGEPITKFSYGGGSGMENDPYLIYTAEQMNEIGLYEEDWDKHFKLMADIDLSAYTGRAFNIIRDFTGVFDGSGHTISNFSHTSTYTDNIGLFEFVYNVNAEIKDLGLIDPNVDAGTGDRVGSLVGYLSRGNVTGCYVEGGSVSGNERVGGLVGYNYRGTITDCSANVDVSGDWYVGGLVGYNRETITDCYAAGIVSGDRYVGSLVGFNDDTIINCSATGIVSGDRYVGGQVGANEGRVTNCSATGSVSGTTAIGGLVGYNRDTISNCYSSGDVTGYSYVGGLVGYNRATITNSYSTGIVLGDRYFGGFVGDNLVGRITDSFWDIEASGQTLGVGLGSDDGISGKTTAEMQSASTFLDAGWDFVDESKNGTEDIWWILEGQGYPVFVWELWDPSPNPQDGATNVIQSPILQWPQADPTLQHDIYFGEDKEAVANATTLSLGIYCGRQFGELATYDPGPLEWGRTYYWRIDEYNTDGTISKGNVWSFTTADFILIDDFEDYNDYPPDEIFSTWIEGWEFPLHLLPGAIGIETWIVHSGKQSMSFYYDNNFKYSEVTKTLVYPRDWTEEGVGVLSLWFYGDPSNAAEPMYVALNGIASVYHDNPDAALIEEWTEWTIDLQEFAAQGVNLANVNTISIGFGDKNNLQAGGWGRVFFDDIRLYQPPELEPAP